MKRRILDQGLNVILRMIIVCLYCVAPNQLCMDRDELLWMCWGGGGGVVYIACLG